MNANCYCAAIICGIAMLAGALSMNAQSKYTVAAYIWPSCHDDPLGHEVLWPEGDGEWEIIKKGTPRFDGHYQPKQPLWGYEHDDDPKVVERWIDLATDHGINTFIFDWYWFNDGPYLEGCLNDGFLKARNNYKMNFYIMWANHDVARNYWNCHRYGSDNSRLWNGAVDWKNFKIIVKRIIDQYFLLPNYYCIDGYPVFSVFSLDNLVKTFGSVDETRKGIEYLETECRKAGLPGVHLQIVTWEKPTPELMAKAKTIGIDSFTVYNWLGGLGSEDYMVCMNAAIEAQERWSNSEIPFFPNASIGWDDTPRFPAKTGKDLIHYNKSPRAFAAYLQKAKEYADRHPNQVPLITVNAWNEWVEDSYLLPDRKYGFDYIKTVKEVLVDEAYEKYQKK